MKKICAAAMLAVCSFGAHAVDFEVGAGFSHYMPRGNMMWYQEGLPYKLDLRAPVIEAGFTGDVNSWLSWHAGYVYMGTVHSDAIATPDDKNYNPQTKSCNGECLAHSRFVGNGNSQGLKLTLEPHYTVKGVRLGVEAGVYVHRNTWDVTVYDWIGAKGDVPKTINAHGGRKWQVAPVVGVTVGHGNLSVAALYYFNKSGSNDPTHSLWKGTATVTVRYRF